MGSLELRKLVIALAAAPLPAQGSAFEAIAENLMGYVAGISWLIWGFLSLRILYGYGILSLPWTSRGMKESGHREVEQSISMAVPVAIGLLIFNVILTILAWGGITPTSQPTFTA